MQINFHSTLRKTIGQKSVLFEIPDGLTVVEMLTIVLTRYPQIRSLILDENNAIDRHAHVIVNGRDVLHLKNGEATVLSTEDTIDIFPIGHF